MLAEKKKGNWKWKKKKLSQSNFKQVVWNSQKKWNRLIKNFRLKSLKFPKKLKKKATWKLTNWKKFKIFSKSNWDSLGIQCKMPFWISSVHLILQRLNPIFQDIFKKIKKWGHGRKEIVAVLGYYKQTPNPNTVIGPTVWYHFCYEPQHVFVYIIYV